MDPIIKQRLVGTLVLVALGVVFWPIIFVQPESDPGLVVGPVPPAPRIDETPLPRPQSPQTLIESTVPMPEVDAEAQAAADEATLLSDEQLATGSADLGAELVPADSLERVDTRESAPPAPERDAAGFAQAWVLQVATLSSQERAQALVKRLQSKGYEAFSKNFSRDGRQLWRVQIGPRVERAKLDNLKREIDASLKVNSAVVRYAPVS